MGGRPPNKTPRDPGLRSPQAWVGHRVDPGGTYSNPRQLADELEALVRRLPDLSAPVRRRSVPVPGTARRLTSTHVGQLVAGYIAGATVYELADQFGIDRKTVSRTLHRNQVSMRMVSLTTEQIDEAVRLYEVGWSTSRIGDRLKVDARTVHRRLRDRGVRLRDTHGRER